MAKLKTNVHVTDDNGAAHVFGPADEVPEWAQALITNPKAWLEPPSPRKSTDVTPQAKAPAKRATPRRKAGNDALPSG
ncbi:hypothetical protein Sfulv_55180 [Streptomyces fulvorobeus]|uniref:Uncharacterized protein n=1 Tax=Streptomyces fulvorobeus TaxID=284028 RepID=A0A7J0CEM2_9ACTN|nr:hypothetical protein [Streptomyces fulvorobeus]GFN00708.1 hypothetical protein Sfulv_55180 [Streptomyces fulvorobeus]